jgi:hypothetical protein
VSQMVRKFATVSKVSGSAMLNTMMTTSQAAIKAKLSAMSARRRISDRAALSFDPRRGTSDLVPVQARGAGPVLRTCVT